MFSFFFFFFFQAEDGIRDVAVTGVQTCALPILFSSGRKLDAASLSRLGWEESTPLETDRITSQDKAINLPRPLDSKQGSFLEVNRPNVLLLTWKEAEDDQGTILRFLEIGGEAGPAEITIPLLKVESAWRCNAMEANQLALQLVGDHGFKFDIKRSEEHTSELQSRLHLVCRLLLEKKKAFRCRSCA